MNSPDHPVPSDKTSKYLLLGIWSHLSQRRRIQLVLLFLVMLLSGFSEVISLASVVPFLAVLSDPSKLFYVDLIQQNSGYFGWESPSDLIIPATLVFAISAIFASVIRLSNLWLNGRMAAVIGSDMSCEAYMRTLYQPYQTHVMRNSSTIINSMITQVGLTVLSLNMVLKLCTSSTVALSLIVALVFINPSVAIASLLIFGSVYIVLLKVSKTELVRNGQKIAETSNLQLITLQEGLGSIRDVLLDGTQQHYVNLYQLADLPQRIHRAKNGFLAAFPRFTLEAIGMVAISLFGAYLVIKEGSGSSVIPLLGALALGSQRLLPSLQQIYSAWSTFKGYNAAIEAVLELLAQPLPKFLSTGTPLNSFRKISFNNVSFRYEKSLPLVIDNISFDIYAGQRIGIVGTTGSGKSTLVDLLMGFLDPVNGQITVDEQDLNSNKSSFINDWRSTIAHVPQSIYLADCSIAQNIALSDPGNLSIDRVRNAAKKAQISSFIESCPNSYSSFVGERGIRLSGGQRQRIGIARALYKNAKVLVFDEATSALDTTTENSVMEAINSLDQNLTVVIIAHRLSTIEKCDKVIKIEKGQIIDENTGNC